MTPGDVIEVRASSHSLPYFKSLRETLSKQGTTAWLNRDADALRGEVVREPERSDIDYTISEQLVVEYYSR